MIGLTEGEKERRSELHWEKIPCHLCKKKGFHAQELYECPTCHWLVCTNCRNGMQVCSKCEPKTSLPSPAPS